MKQRPRIYYTEAQKAMMWDRWSKGDTLHQIGKLFDRPHTSIHNILAATGSHRSLAKLYGINPKTMAKWRARTSVLDEPMGPRDRASRHLS